MPAVPNAFALGRKRLTDFEDKRPTLPRRQSPVDSPPEGGQNGHCWVDSWRYGEFDPTAIPNTTGVDVGVTDPGTVGVDAGMTRVST